jgi:hypothetical protein
MKNGIRHKIAPRLLRAKNVSRETKVIVLSDEKYEIPSELLSSFVSSSQPWNQRFSLGESNNQDLRVQYAELISVLLLDLYNTSEESLKSKIIRHSRDIISRNTDQIYSRYARKRMLGRLLSLLVDFELISEVVGDDKVVSVTISEKDYFRVHYNDGTMLTQNWFTSQEEASLLRLVLARKFELGQTTLTLPANLDVTISSLRSENLQSGSIFITPVRSKKKSMLDLIRAKVISPQLARNVSKSIIGSGQGYLISGGLDSGKSGLLSALISSLSANSVPLIIANDKDLGTCHPHAELLTHDDIERLLSGDTHRSFEDSIFRMGARHVFVDDLNPRLYGFLLRMKLVYDIPIIATIPSINPKQFLNYLLEDVRFLSGLQRDVDEAEISQLVDAFPYVISLSAEKQFKGVSCIYELVSSEKSFHLVPVIKRMMENQGAVWRITEVASSDTVMSIGYGM